MNETNVNDVQNSTVTEIKTENMTFPQQSCPGLIREELKETSEISDHFLIVKFVQSSQSGFMRQDHLN